MFTRLHAQVAQVARLALPAVAVVLSAAQSPAFSHPHGGSEGAPPSAPAPAADQTQAPASPRLGSVIFIHPDGTSVNSWTAARMLLVGPDADLNWDKLPAIGVYRGHMRNELGATSNGGATTHATGVKVDADAFGLSAGGGRGEPLRDAQGRPMSVARRALAAGLPVGLVQTGIAPEPGTACFVTEVQKRSDYAEIARQLVESGAQVMLGGGEKYFLPKGVEGFHGTGVREDGLDLLAIAKDRGYTVVRTRDELAAISDKTTKLLGVFAENHTFNDEPEEALAKAGKPLYEPLAPTVGEMTAAALKVLTATGQRFLLVVEEEGTDNFGNNNNAAGMFEAFRRADEAIGIARDYLRQHPDTLIMTAADSDAGGPQVVAVTDGEPGKDGWLSADGTLPPRDGNGAPLDGVSGTGSAPFTAKPDRFGKTHAFAIAWASGGDVAGGIIVRGEGLGAEMIRGSIDNTRVAEIMKRVLLGE